MEADQLSVTTEQNEVEEVVCATNRHPWLGVFLNCFAFSGAGYLYGRRYGRACLAIASSLMIYAAAYVLVFVESVSFGVLLTARAAGVCMLKAAVSIDAFRTIRRRNTAAFETLRKCQ